MATTCNLTSSAPSNPHRSFGDGPSSSSVDDGLIDGSWHGTTTRIARSNVPQSSSAGSIVGPRAPLTPYPPPGSFSSELRDTGFSRGTPPRQEFAYGSPGSRAMDDDITTTEERQAIIRGKIEKELKIKSGTENMLEALMTKNPKKTRQQRLKVESELVSSNRKLEQLQLELDQEISRNPSTTRSGLSHLSTLFSNNLTRTALRGTGVISEEDESETESPTYVLAETLQALEVEGMQADYYVERANSLVELFKRHPTLKYDLEWTVFGLRVQMMLLNDSREVIAAGYRLTRYAIVDRNSIQIIRGLRTDEFVMHSLMKETKTSVEREQALKFVRAFLDVKDGVSELSRAVVRTLVSIADHREDRLRGVAIITLSEILLRDPGIVYAAGGIGVLNEAIAEGTVCPTGSLVTPFLHVLDSPRTRKYLKFGGELDSIFSCFTECLPENERNARIYPAGRSIFAMLSSWPGLLTLAQNRARALRSLIQSLQYQEEELRTTVLDLIHQSLRIKSPSWSQSYLAGRRLTTYGRVTNLRSSEDEGDTGVRQPHDDKGIELTTHFTALLLAVLIDAGLVKALSDMIEDEPRLLLKRKATLMLTEVLRRANQILPQAICAKVQVLPQLIPSMNTFDHSLIPTTTIYHLESVTRTMMRSDAGLAFTKDPDSIHDDPMLLLASGGSGAVSSAPVPGGSTANKPEPKKLPLSLDEAQFRTAIMDTNVLNSHNYLKWDWELIHAIVEGPLTNTKRLDEAIKGSKFMKRLMGFYRPFKYRFSTARNTKPNQRYVRTGCALMKTLLKSPEGTKYLAENKLLRQMAEALAQVDRLSGLTSEEPVLSRKRVADSLTGGYFALLGTISSVPHGVKLMEKWHMPNMFYHIVELRDRNDLIRLLLGNMDYTLDSHLRIILSKALTTASKDIRIYATGLLKKYVVNRTTKDSPVDWVIKLLVTQLYDPELSVCQVAVKILEEACIERDSLELVVRCRPSLDHLGEIGAPLLLRFLSTSIGYKYLNDLDYVTQEMDDWFLGRNDAYVGLVEATLGRAYYDQRRRVNQQDEKIVEALPAYLPPHFYRELVRTEDGCELLRNSGHFEDFASSIRNFRHDEDDPEILLKVKGCLWAIGNLGTMRLAAPFLQESGVVGDIAKIAESAAVLSMRGTAFLVLGLISRSEHGLELLYQAGWNTALDPNGASMGWPLPTDLSKICSEPFTPRLHAELEDEERSRYSAAVNDPDPLAQKILRLIIELSNTVVSKRTAADLNLIKRKRPEYFRQIHLFRKALVILESHNFKLPSRRFVFDLFDKDVMRRLVLGEEELELDSEMISDTDSMASER